MLSEIFQCNFSDICFYGGPFVYYVRYYDCLMNRHHKKKEQDLLTARTQKKVKVKKVEKIEEIYSIGSRKIERRTDENSIEIILFEYPIYPYLNYIATHLLLDKKTSTISMWTSNESWGEPEPKHYGVVKLSEEEYSIIYEKILNVKSPQDFMKVAEIFEEMMKRRKEEFDKIVDNLTTKFIDVYTYDHALTLVKDEEILNELKKDVKQYISEWLTS